MKEYIIQPKHGGRIEVSNGQTITVVDVDGGQVANFFAEVKGTLGWRRMFLSEAFPAATFLLLILFVPETPRYLTLTGRDQKALQVLTRINGAAEARTIHTEIRRTVHAKTERLFAYGAAVILIGIPQLFISRGCIKI